MIPFGGTDNRLLNKYPVFEGRAYELSEQRVLSLLCCAFVSHLLSLWLPCPSLLWLRLLWRYAAGNVVVLQNVGRGTGVDPTSGRGRERGRNVLRLPDLGRSFG